MENDFVGIENVGKCESEDLKANNQKHMNIVHMLYPIHNNTTGY